MNIQTNHARPNRLAQRQAPQESSSLFLDLNPFSGVKESFRSGAENAGEFLYGAMPGLGLKAHGENVFNFFGSSSDGNRAKVGALANAAGTVAGMVALGQLALGGDPTIATGLAAAGLATSGVLHAVNEG